jgi:isoprenylcysteine carboxyl methyltransferase (ICMT) family protein YpbQ
MTVLAAELTLHQSVKYVAGAYAVFLAVVLIYVVVMSIRLRHNSRELAELRRELLTQAAAEEREPESAPVA